MGSVRKYAGLLLFTLLALGSSLAQADSNVPSSSETGQFILKFAPGINPHIADLAMFQAGVESISVSKMTKSIVVESVADLDAQYIKELLSVGFIEYFEENAVVSTFAVPSDANFSNLWGLNNNGSSGGRADVDIDAPEAWDITTGSDEIVVGVIDTGVDYTHPDLAPNMWINPFEIAGNGIDDDGNGYIDDVHGANVNEITGNPQDDNGHGTHVAGTIGAKGNNGTGIVGVNWNVKIMALRFLSSSGYGSIADAIRAFEYAIELKRRGVNIRVLNNSWGGSVQSSALEDIIRLAGDEGIVVVAAAGNEAKDNDRVDTFPANINSSNVISVAAVDSQGNLASFSNFGQSKVHVAAPGVSILSTWPNQTYRSLRGTSMAAPHVSGAAALVLSHYPSLTPYQVRNSLTDNVKPLQSLNGVVSSGGMLSLYSALTREPNTNLPEPTIIEYSRQSLSFGYDSNTGDKILEEDDGYSIKQLPFSFDFFGTSFDRIAISSNGRVMPLTTGEDIDSLASDYGNSPRPGLAVFHDDLVPASDLGGGVFLKTSSTSATVTWVARFYADRSRTDEESLVTFQLVIKRDGSFDYHYSDVVSGNTLFDNGASAVIGIVTRPDSLGSDLTLGEDEKTSTISNNRALRFTSSVSSARSDFDGDGISDIVIWRPQTGNWFILQSSTNFDYNQHLVIQLGLAGDRPLTADFDGDKQSDMAVWRPSNGMWYFRLSTEGYTEISNVQWGLEGDTPFAEDADGDGVADLFVYRPSNGTFYGLHSSAGFDREAALSGQTRALTQLRHGGEDFDPLLDDFSGDGRAEFMVVWREIRFWSALNYDGTLLFSEPWGTPQDQVTSCDWNHDGKADKIILRPTETAHMEWWVDTRGGVFTDTFGLYGDNLSCRNDYDGDGHGDLRAWRNANAVWYIKDSASGQQREIQFGLPGDIAL